MTKRLLLLRASLLLATAGLAPLHAAPSLPGADIGITRCCPGCANGGPLGADGQPLAGTTSSVVSTSAAPAAEAPPRVAAPAPATAATAPKADPKSVLEVDFSRLADFAYAPPAKNEPPTKGLPDAVLGLDARRVKVRGYLLPFEIDNGRCRRFLILRNQASCCFGGVPLPNEWIVGASAKGIPAIQDEPLEFVGTLRVGACFEGDMFTGVYSLDVENEPGR